MPLSSSLGTRTSTLGGSLVLGPIFMPPQLDVFSTDPGVDAGRILPSGILPDSGAYAFCLGHDTPGFTGFVVPGEYVEVTQTDTMPSSTMLTFQAVTRAPSVPPPPGYAWQADVLVDGTSVGTRVLALEGPVSWEWAMDTVPYASGSHTLAFRLTLTGPSIPTPTEGTDQIPYLDLEIPAFYVASLGTTNIGAATIATNEVPVANQGITIFDGPVPANTFGGPPPLDTTSVSFDLFGRNASVNPSGLNVTFLVNGSITSTPIVGGAFTTGYSGTIGSTGEIVHVDITPAVAFPSDALVEVTVSLSPYSRSWSFQVADTTPPVIASILAIATNQLQVTWSKNVLLDNPESPTDGLNPSLYYVTAAPPNTITPAVSGGPTGALVYAAAPYLTVTSVSIQQDSGPSVVVLTLSDDMTPGIPYTLTEVNVADLVGNTVICVGAFTSFTPPSPPGRSFNLWQRVPEQNRREDSLQELRRFIACAQEVYGLALARIDAWTQILNYNVAPDIFVQAMLEDLGNPFPFPLTTLQRRQLVPLLVLIYKQKGTKQGIVNAVNLLLGLEVSIDLYNGTGMQLGTALLGQDWILGPGTSAQLYSFSVVYDAGPLTATQVQQILFIANYMKVAHEHVLGVITPSTPTPTPMELGISLLGDNWILSG